MSYNVQPVVNWKCLVFTLYSFLLYWVLPKHNKWILLSVLFFPYLILAWYDYYYSCQRNMGPTYLSLFYSWGKPQESEQIKEYQNWNPEIKKKVRIVDLSILVVLLLCLPMFLRWNPGKIGERH
jgi:hypothetical protein